MNKLLPEHIISLFKRGIIFLLLFSLLNGLAALEIHDSTQGIEDYYSSVFNEVRRVEHIASTPYSKDEPKPVTKPILLLASLHATDHHSRKFAQPPHHNYLFLLTPF